MMDQKIGQLRQELAALTIRLVNIKSVQEKQPPEDFPEGRGEAHGVDEAVSPDRLERAMRIYARALLRLNETVW